MTDQQIREILEKQGLLPNKEEREKAWRLLQTEFTVLIRHLDKEIDKIVKR